MKPLRRPIAHPLLALILMSGLVASALARADGAEGAASKPSAPGAPATGAAEPGKATPDAPPADAEGDGTAPPPPEVLRQIDKGKAEEDKAQSLRTAASEHPNEISYQIAYARGLLDLGRTEEAVDIASSLVEKFPRSVELMTILGLAQARDGQFEIASLQYQRALALDPSNARAQTLAAGASFMRGDLKGAEAGYRKALALDPNLTDARDSLATLLARNGKYREANELLTRGGKTLSGRFALLPSLVKDPPFVLPGSFQKVSVPFVTARGYPPFIRIKINEKTEKLFVVNTGSEEIVLTSSAAKSLGLPEAGEGIIKDADGRDHVAPAYLVLDSFRIGDLLVKRIPVRVMPGLTYPDEQIGGSVGRDLLRRFRVALDYTAQTLTLARGGGKPLDGTRFDVAGVILVDGYRGDRAVGKFVVDTSSYTPGAMDILWVARETGFTVYSKNVKPIPEGPYLFKFTMPDLRVDEADFKNFSATAVDLRQMARSIGVNVRGVIGNSLLKQCRLEIDFENQRFSLHRAAPPPSGATDTPPAASPEPGM